MVLKINDVLFARDENGELIPETVKLVINENDEEQFKYKDQEISIIPMMRGEIRKLFSKISMQTSSKKDEEDLDGELIYKYCVNPKIEKEDIKAIKPIMATMIVNTIFHYSGLDSSKPRKKAIQDAEDDFAKN